MGTPGKGGIRAGGSRSAIHIAHHGIRGRRGSRFDPYAPSPPAQVLPAKTANRVACPPPRTYSCAAGSSRITFPTGSPARFSVRA